MGCCSVDCLLFRAGLICNIYYNSVVVVVYCVYVLDIVLIIGWFDSLIWLLVWMVCCLGIVLFTVFDCWFVLFD